VLHKRSQGLTETVVSGLDLRDRLLCCSSLTAIKVVTLMYLLQIVPFIYDTSVNLHKVFIVLALNFDSVHVTTFSLTTSLSHPVVNAVGPTGDNPNFNSLNADILDIEFNAAKVVV